MMKALAFQPPVGFWVVIDGDDLVVDRQVAVDVEHGGGVLAQAGGGDAERAVLDRPGARVDEEPVEGGGGVEVRRAQHVAGAAGDVAGLRVARAAGLVLPGVVLLGHEADLAEGLAVAGGRRGPARWAMV